MLAGSIKIRSFHAGCAHEILLPGGKHLLIDPFFRDSLGYGYTLEDVHGADYILLTHTHFDHDLDLGYFAKKFNSLVFVGAFSARALLRYHGLAYDQVIPVLPGEKYTLDDFTLEVIGAKHNPNGGKVYDPDRDIALDAKGVAGHQECDENGNLESVDYFLTTPCGFRMQTVSGRFLWKEPYEISKEKCPDLLLRQAGVRRGGAGFENGQQVSPKELADLFMGYRAKILMPFHMDMVYRALGTEATEEYFKEVGRLIHQQGQGMEFLYPRPWKWYQIGLAVREEEEA